MIGFVRSFRPIVVLVYYWPKSASVRLNQTIKAIDLACELYERRWDSWAFRSGRWDSGDESYLYLQILFTNFKKVIFLSTGLMGRRSSPKNGTRRFASRTTLTIWQTHSISPFTLVCPNPASPPNTTAPPHKTIHIDWCNNVMHLDFFVCVPNGIYAIRCLLVAHRGPWSLKRRVHVHCLRSLLWVLQFRYHQR
jgi:hypothetical protein